jgi:DNA mismatch repair ATPase MutL
MISTVKITEVKSNPNNPRTIKDEKFKKLVESIKGFPQMLSLRPIVVNDDMVVLGGNLRLKACKQAGLKEVPIIKASELTDEQQKEFIIKDNVGFGDWDWDTLSNEWDVNEINDWGLDIPNFENHMVDLNSLSDDFSLPEGDKEPFQQMTFTLADDQAEKIKNAIEEIKETQEYKYCETMGNTNINGNALYLIIMQWAEQKKLL